MSEDRVIQCMSINIVLNGSSFVVNGETLLDLLHDNNIPLNKIAVDINGLVIPKDKYKDYILKSGDVIEVITFVGGG